MRQSHRDCFALPKKKRKTPPVYARELTCIGLNVIINPLTGKPACCSLLFCDASEWTGPKTVQTNQALILTNGQKLNGRLKIDCITK